MDYTNILDKMESHGINTHELRQKGLLADGKKHRFKVDPSDKNPSGWYVIYHNHSKKGIPYIASYFGDFRSMHREDNYYTYVTLNGESTEEDIAQIEEQRKIALKEIAKELKQKQLSIALDFQDRYSKMKSNSESKYLKNKKIDSLKTTNFKVQKTGIIHVPAQDITGFIWCDQTIDKDGTKLFQTGAKTSGVFNLFGEIHPESIILLAEGFATAASLYLATGFATVCAFSVHNLKPVYYELRKKYNNKIVLCGDDDLKTQKEKGTNPGRSVESFFPHSIYPVFSHNPDLKYSDFNDLHCNEGLEIVKKQINDYLGIQLKFPRMNGNRPFCCIENIEYLMKYLNITCRYNVVKKENEIIIPGVNFSIDNKANASINHIINQCALNRINNASNISNYVDYICEKQNYNPAIEWILSKPWDGKSRINELNSTITIRNEDQENEVALKNKILKTWSISGIAALFNKDGLAASGVLTFTGIQGIGKSRWILSLAPKELNIIKGEYQLIIDDKDSQCGALKYWITELGELDSTFNKSDISKLKAFITKGVDEIRLPYNRKFSQFPRRTVLFASVNDEEFLRDKTGNRRFWVLDVVKINYEHSIDMQQYWAEIYELYKQGEPCYLTNDWQEKVNIKNQDFEIKSYLEDKILSYYDWESNVLSHQKTIFEIAIDLGLEKPNNSECQSISRALKRISKTPPIRSNGRRFFYIPEKKVSKFGI